MKVVWGVEHGSYKDGGWRPLWLRDSIRIEERFINGEIDEPLTIRNTHEMADIKNRIVTSTYTEGSAPKSLIRGTWFWTLAPNKLIAFREDTASAIESWYKQIKVLLPLTVSFPRKLLYVGRYF